MNAREKRVARMQALQEMKETFQGVTKSFGSWQKKPVNREKMVYAGLLVLFGAALSAKVFFMLPICVLLAICFMLM